MEVVATRCGWVRFGDVGVDGAARLTATSTGRLAVAEVVLAGPSATTARLRPVEAWANGPGLEAATAGLAERESALAGSLTWLMDVDAAERAEPARRAQWGTGGDVEADQDAMRALVVDADGRTDEFFAEVARAYGEASVRSSRPAQMLARENAVGVDVVYGWVKEARRRGIMPPGRKGAAA